MTRAMLLLLAAAAATALLVAQEPAAVVIPKERLATLASAARQIARAGWIEEAERLVAAMKVLGLPEADAEKLVATCRKEIPKDKTRTPLPAVAKSLRGAAEQLAKLVPKTPTSAAMAAAILTIDDSIASLHEMLGHKKVDGRWQTEEGAKAAARRGEIVATLAKARRLNPEVAVSEESDPIFEEIHNAKCTTVSAGGVTLRGRWTASKLTRILLEALRAAAVSEYLIGGTLEIPKLNHDVLILDTKKDYDAAVTIAARRKWIDDKEIALTRTLSGFYPKKETSGTSVVSFKQTEADAEASLLYNVSAYLRSNSLCPPLHVGHINWVCLSYLGTPMPGVLIEDVKVRERRTGGHRPEDFETMLRVGEGGIAGSRSWLRWLAQERRDPPFANAIVDQDGKVEGDERTKCTFVVEFLQEMDELCALGDRTKMAQRAEFEQVWGSLAAFEERWRTWLLGAMPPIAAAIDPTRPRALTKSETEVLARLNDLRRKCFQGSICGEGIGGGVSITPDELVDPYLEVTQDDELSRGTRLHALYLARHPDQLAAWPDAHEEWPDRAGFTPEGGWAGGHSVIAPGVTSASEALDAWLGTYYHRLPLIHPGLVRLGWGHEKNIAVLDCGSIARPVPGTWHVVWPYDGMKDVPTHFAPELPNPVPGADQSQFGYPVTLQIGEHVHETAPPTITVEIHESAPTGMPVPCHVSTPSEPSYADLPTPDAWCLIPKAPLKPGTTYHALATWSTGRKIAWSFKTRAR